MEIGLDAMQTLASNLVAHDVVTLPAAGDVTLIVAANPRRRRVIMVNTTAPGADGAASTAVVGAKRDDDGNDLADGNGFPLSGAGGTEFTIDASKYFGYAAAYVLVLETKDAVYGVATGGADAAIAFVEETN